MQRATRFHSCLTPLARGAIAAAALSALCLHASAQTAQFDIPAQPLPEALARFARQSGVQLVYPPALVQGRRASAVQGAQDAEAALRQLLRGSGLRMRRDGATLVLESLPADGAATLPEVRVTAQALAETATGPVQGFVAHRGATATKTDTSLIETPQSISVVTRDELATLAPSTLRDALGYTPGVQVDQGADLRSEWFSIRGFRGTQNVFRDGLRAAYVPGGFANGDLDPYALERIEVLGGPSSVLYGQAQPGGIVNLVTKRPQDETQREIELTAGSFGRKQLAFDFTGPLGPDSPWSYRLTGLVRDSGTQTDFIRNDRVYIAPALTWRPSADTSLTILANYQRDAKGSTADYDLPRVGTLSPNVNGWIPINRMNSEPAFDRYAKPQSSIGYLFDHRLDETWTFRQNVRLSRIATTYAGVYSYGLDPDERTVYRGAYTERDAGNVLAIDNQMQAKWTQGRLAHVLLMGFDYRGSRSAIQAADGPAPSIDIFNPVYGAAVTPPDLYENSKTRASQLGLYAQDQIKLDKRWVFLLGGRWDQARSTKDESVYDTRTTQRDKAFTGRVGSVYLFDNGFAPYASYSTSFIPEIGTTAAGNAFKPTRGRQFEVGFRYQPPGGGGVFSAAVFDLTQQNVLTVDPNDINARIQTGEIRSRGFQLEQKLSVSREVNVAASYTYMDARITRSNDGVQGNRVGAVPRHAAAVWADYKPRSELLRGFSIGAGARFSGRTPVADTNVYSLPARTLLDALVRYEWQKYTFSLKVTNLLDKKFVSQCGSDDYGYCTYGLRRSVMASLNYRW